MAKFDQNGKIRSEWQKSNKQIYTKFLMQPYFLLIQFVVKSLNRNSWYITCHLYFSIFLVNLRIHHNTCLTHCINCCLHCSVLQLININCCKHLQQKLIGTLAQVNNTRYIFNEHYLFQTGWLITQTRVTPASNTSISRQTQTSQ